MQVACIPLKLWAEVSLELILHAQGQNHFEQTHLSLHVSVDKKEALWVLQIAMRTVCRREAPAKQMPDYLHYIHKMIVQITTANSRQTTCSHIYSTLSCNHTKLCSQESDPTSLAA